MFRNERLWRILANLWTVVIAVFLIVDFFSFNKYDYLTATFSVIYTAVLSLYVGTKEFERWCDTYEGRRHPGEWFIIGWTALMLFMIVAKMIGGEKYSISPEAVSDYIIVLSLFALTQKSKKMCSHGRNRNNRRK